MNRRHFWLIPEFIKFRTVFETSETILGADERNEHRLFRKDTGKICFDEREALQVSIAKMIETETEDFLAGKVEAVRV
jgi:hypothetical protein